MVLAFCRCCLGNVIFICLYKINIINDYPYITYLLYKQKIQNTDITTFLYTHFTENTSNTFNNIDKDGNGSISLQEFIDDIKKQTGGSNDRQLYIREMCKTQIELFRELKEVINKIVAADS